MAQFSKQGIQKSLRSIWEDSGMLVIFIVLFLLLAIFVPYFLTWRNMIGLGLSVSMVGMVYCTILFCLASGDIDFLWKFDCVQWSDSRCNHQCTNMSSSE